MKVTLTRLWKEDDGVLAFEWVLLVTLLTIGIVGGLAAARDAIVDELGDVAQAMLGVDQSYFLAPSLAIDVHAPPTAEGGSGQVGSEFIDAFFYSDCGRNTLTGQNGGAAVEDGPEGP